ncbi:MAG TPA: septum formation family protein [Streptosporangiaceae bacterium]
MGLRYNPPPGWPPPPPGFSPRPGWQPDPSWGPPPPGWQLWLNDDEPPAQDWPRQPPPAQDWAGQGPPAQDWAGQGPPSGWAAEPTPGGRGSRRAAAGGGTSGWAVTSFILGILAVIPLSVIFGFVALQRIRRLGQRGRGLAIAGLVLSVVWAGVFVLVGVTSSGTATRQSSTGKITHRGDLGVFALAVGDCFDNPTNTQDIESVTAIPCTQAHNSQVFAKFDLTGDDSNYPAQQDMTRLADGGCNSRTSSIDKTRTTSDMDIRVLFPEQDAWADGQRTVSCLVVSSSANVTSSLLKS